MEEEKKFTKSEIERAFTQSIDKCIGDQDSLIKQVNRLEKDNCSLAKKVLESEK